MFFVFLILYWCINTYKNVLAGYIFPDYLKTTLFQLEFNRWDLKTCFLDWKFEDSVSTHVNFAFLRRSYRRVLAL